MQRASHVRSPTTHSYPRRRFASALPVDRARELSARTDLPPNLSRAGSRRRKSAPHKLQRTVREIISGLHFLSFLLSPFGSCFFLYLQYVHCFAVASARSAREMRAAEQENVELELLRVRLRIAVSNYKLCLCALNFIRLVSRLSTCLSVRARGALDARLRRPMNVERERKRERSSSEIARPRLGVVDCLERNELRVPARALFSFFFC